VTGREQVVAAVLRPASGLALAQGRVPSARDDDREKYIRIEELTMYQKILVPLDGSETAQCGLDEAIALAKTTGASLRLVHVIEPVPVATDMMTAGVWGALLAGQHEAGEQLLAAATAAAERAGVKSTCQVLDRPGERVADAILHEAKTSGCDLIVMGTHGRRGFKHLMLGSAAERVLQLSHLPVLAMRHRETRR
jgi:nucleotide-binding universal stress UspA family protein